MTFGQAWNRFFHARTNGSACVLGGLLRVGYAIIFLADRLVLGLDLDAFFSPSQGLVPYSVGRQSRPPPHLTIFQLAPESETLLWAMHYLGLVQGFLLLVGIAPRFQLVGLYFNMVSFHNHNFVFWDYQDTMMRIYAFMMYFLPLHRLTIHDAFRPNWNRWKKDSWPMWPFRIFQLDLCFMYIGASIGKLAGPEWRQGTAIYYISYTDTFYGGYFNPEILFDRMLPLMVMNYVSLAVELSCWITVWFESLRVPTIVVMFLLHFGIDASMNMHTFEWNSMLGWLVFHAKPVTEAATGAATGAATEGGTNETRTWRMVTNLFVVSILSLFALDTLPCAMDYLHEWAPSALQPVTGKIMDTHWQIKGIISHWLLVPAGCWQGCYEMYTESPNSYNAAWEALVLFKNDTEVSWWSPDWKNMTWFEKKRYQREMDYWESLSAFEDQPDEIERLCERISELHGREQVAAVDLTVYWEFAPDPPAHVGWFEPVHQEMIQESDHVWTLDLLKCNEWDDETALSESQ